MKLRLKSIKNRSKSMLLDLKNRMEVMHELDYTKHRLYLCDNVRIESCKKEPGTVRWIESFQEHETAFDIGANVGAYSLLMALYAKAVYAFEPAISNFTLLCKNILVNQAKGTLPSPVTPFNIALSEKTGLQTLNYINVRAGKSGHQIGRTQDGFGQGFKPRYSHPMLCYSLDSFLETFGVDTPSHLKIDVDGIEWAILQGAANTLTDKRLRSILVEVQEGTPEQKQIDLYLKSKQFEPVEKHLLDPATGFHNYLFRRQSG